jgi:hypothetical protein
MVMTTFPKQSANRHWFEQKSCQNFPKIRRPALIYTASTGFNKNQAEISQNICRPALVLQNHTAGTGFNKNQAEISQNICRPALVLQKSTRAGMHAKK